MSPWVDMPQERIDLFAKATEDFQWIHIDPARAKDSPFGSTIAHGFLTLSMLPKLVESTFDYSTRKMGVNYGLNKVRFPSPTPVNGRIRGHVEIAAVERGAKGSQVVSKVTVELEGSDRPVCVAEMVVMCFE